jgi:hypothetical protein
MKRTHLYEKIGVDHIFATRYRAVEVIHSRTHTQCNEDACPLLSVCFVEDRSGAESVTRKEEAVCQ